MTQAKVRKAKQKTKLLETARLVRKRQQKPATSVQSDSARTPQHIARQLVRRFPSLFQFTEGKEFSAQAFQSWVRVEPGLDQLKSSSVHDAGLLLNKLAQPTQSSSSSSRSTPASASRRFWEPEGFQWIDEEGEASVDNVRGCSSRKHGSSVWHTWHEYGYLYQLAKVCNGTRPSFVVTQTNAYKTLGAIQSKLSMKVKADGRQVSLSNVLTFDPWTKASGRTQPEWSFVYLHGFSNKGTDYVNFPHYFTIPDAPVRVVCPTAPLLEQSCFPDWYDWKGSKMGWRRIKFNAWFDYMTDRAGRAENKIDVASLEKIRARIHGLIREEVQRVGSPKRVIVGGASQGCCVALDAALTYPEELGGVIGLVGHVLSATPLDRGRERSNMPIQLFQESNDKEVNWKWVRGIVDRVTAAGFNVTTTREPDPYGSGHWIQEIEGEWITRALHEIVSKAPSVA